jgi:hypothetical protein
MSNAMEFQQELVHFPARYINAVGLKDAVARKTFSDGEPSFFDDFINARTVTCNELGDVDIRFVGGYTVRTFQIVCGVINRFILHPITLVFKSGDSGESAFDYWYFIAITFKPGGDGDFTGDSLLTVFEPGRELGVESVLVDNTHWDSEDRGPKDDNFPGTPIGFPTQPDITVSIDGKIATFHQDGGFNLHEFLQTLDHWAATQEFGDRVFVEHIGSEDRVNYTVYVVD